MSEEKIYKLNWQYDVWTDIESCFPKGTKVSAEVTGATRNYAFLKTENGTQCFLSKDKVSANWKIMDLTDHLIKGDTIECKVFDYNVEKKRLIVSSEL